MASETPRTRICVYCGSQTGNSPEYMQTARDLGKLMAEQDIELVYGGGTVGLMGEIAKTIVSLKGPEFAYGIIPDALVKWERDDTYADKADENGRHLPDETVYGKTRVVPDMHTRKLAMAQRVKEGGPGSGFVALSGGYGTFEELLEMITWNQIGIHSIGVVALNVNGFYDGLLALIDKSSEAGFIKGENRNILSVATDARGAIDALRSYKVSGSRYDLAWENS